MPVLPDAPWSTSLRGRGSILLWVGAALMLSGFFAGCEKRGAAPVSEEGSFAILDRFERWSSLNAAIAAAQPGDTVVIDHDGEVPYAPFVTTMPLRLQAAAGRRPVLVSTADDASFIRAEASLVLEGLTLMQHVLESERSPCLIQANAPLLVTNCRLGRIWRGRERLLGQPPVIQSGGARLVIENSELFAPSSNLIFVRGNESGRHELVLRNNAITAAFAVTLVRGRAAQDHGIDISQNNVLGGAFFNLDDDRGMTIEVSAERNVADVHTLFGGNMPWEKFVSLLPKIEWQGRENLYACKCFRVSFRGNQPREAYEVDELSEWESMPTFHEEGSIEEARAIAIDWLPKDYVMDPVRLEVEGNLEKKKLEMNRDFKVRYPDRGMKSEFVGPEPSWDAWRGSPSFAAWDEQVTTILNLAAKDEGALLLPSRSERP